MRSSMRLPAVNPDAVWTDWTDYMDWCHTIEVTPKIWGVRALLRVSLTAKCNNKAVLALLLNTGMHSPKVKHIDNRHHQCSEETDWGTVSYEYCSLQTTFLIAWPKRYHKLHWNMSAWEWALGQCCNARHVFFWSEWYKYQQIHASGMESHLEGFQCFHVFPLLMQVCKHIVCVFLFFWHIIGLHLRCLVLPSYLYSSLFCFLFAHVKLLFYQLKPDLHDEAKKPAERVYWYRPVPSSRNNTWK